MTKHSLEELYILQKGLDEDIALHHPGVTYESTLEKRVLALLVELGEFANETRCFKFWSLKGPSPNERILDEYADALHFFLSIGLAIGVSDFSFEPKEGHRSLYLAILSVYSEVVRFNDERTVENYQNAFASFLDLLPLLGYSFEDMESAYKAKLSVNYKRQESHY